MNFHARFRNYFLKVAEVLRGDADIAAVFPNSTDIGTSRERVYAEFLRHHAPSKCNVFLGGFLFHLNGTESKQLDVIVTTDTAPRYNFLNRDGEGKSFSPVEGALGVASIKSTLDKAQLFDSLDGIASIPPTEPLTNRIPFTIQIKNYDDWPYKIIYASNGLTLETILSHINDYYTDHSEVPLARRPNAIHVAGKYALIRADGDYCTLNRVTGDRTQMEIGTYYPYTIDPDLQAMCIVINGLTERATASTHIHYNYGELLNHVNVVR